MAAAILDPPPPRSLISSRSPPIPTPSQACGYSSAQPPTRTYSSSHARSCCIRHSLHLRILLLLRLFSTTKSSRLNHIGLARTACQGVPKEIALYKQWSLFTLVVISTCSSDGAIECSSDHYLSYLPRLFLPTEILLTIFKSIRPPSYLHDPSICRGTRNPWLTTLCTVKAFTIVCTAWSGPSN